MAALTTAAPVGDPDSIERIGDLMGNPPDLMLQQIGSAGYVLYLDTLADHARLAGALRSLAARPDDSWPWAASPAPPGAVALPEVAMDERPVLTCGQAVRALLAGKAVAVRVGRRGAAALRIGSWPDREVAEPKSEVVVEGPHAGFVEGLNTNLALIRQRIPEPSLRWEQIVVGRRSHSDGALLHLDGMVRPELVEDVRRRLRRSEPSFTLDATMLSQWLSRREGFLFPTIGKTERPDVAAAALLEGRVVTLVQGSPVALILPWVFADLFHSPEDNYNRAFAALFKRSLRVLGTVVALLVSSLFVALVTVNRELVPTQLYISIAQARAGVPAGAVPEILALELMVEVIREAGVHLPGTLGQTISVVGAVVIGQSAVIAGLISAPSIVVVSIGYICSFTLPSQDGTLAIRVLRYPLILLAGALGLFGIAWGLGLIGAFLCALESVGVPYLAPVAPSRPRGLQDALWRRSLPRLRRSMFARRPRVGGNSG